MIWLFFRPYDFFLKVQNNANKKWLWIVWLTVAAMVFIFDVNSEHVAYAWRKISLFRGEKIRFVTDLDLFNCLKQKKLKKLLNTCEPISEVPSNIIEAMVDAEPTCNCLSCERVWCRRDSCRGVSPSLSVTFRFPPSLTNNLNSKFGNILSLTDYKRSYTTSKGSRVI